MMSKIFKTKGTGRFQIALVKELKDSQDAEDYSYQHRSIFTDFDTDQTQHS